MPDRAEVAMQLLDGQDVDEIKMFLDGRYIQSSEAVHRVLRFKTHYQNPTVKRLAVHLDGEQFVLFRGNVDPSQVPDKETTLTAWFRLNQVEARGGAPEVSRLILYTDIVEKYRYEKGVWVASNFPLCRDPAAIGGSYFL